MLGLPFMCLVLNVLCVSRANPMMQNILNAVNMEKTVNLDKLQNNGSLSEMFHGSGGEVTVSEVGNKILRVAGDLPNNGTLLIQGESYMELFDPNDIQNPLTLLEKIGKVKKKPVSVSLAVSEPYFLFSAPKSAQLALDKIAGRGPMQGMQKSSLSEVFKLSRVKRHHPQAMSSALSRLQSYALVPIKTESGATRYLLLKDPKFIVQNNPKPAKKKRPSHTNHSQINVRPLPKPATAMKPTVRSMTPGSSAQALKPSNSPGSSARISAVKPGSKAAQASKNPLHRATLTDHNKNVQFRRMPVRSGGTLGAPSQHRSGIVQLGRMPPEAGGGGLTVANRINRMPSPRTLTNVEQTLMGLQAGSGQVVNKPAPVSSGFSKNTGPSAQLVQSGSGLQQEVVNFENARLDSLAKLNAVIENNAEKRDVVNFAKSLLATMRTLNVLVLKHGEKRETASFAQSMLSGMKKLDQVFKSGNKRDVVNFAKSLVDTIKQFNIESGGQIVDRQKPTSTVTTTSMLTTTGTTSETTTETTTQSTTVTTVLDVTEEPDPVITTEEYEQEEMMLSTEFPMGTMPLGTTLDFLLPYFGPATHGPPAPPPVAGWQGTTPEPALGPLDRLNTTDVPEEIEARPDKTPAEKRRDFLERNPHLRAKLRKRKRKKKAKTTTTTATIENNNPEQTTPSLVQSAPPTNTASSATEAGSKQPKETNSKAKSNLKNLVLQRKDPSKKGKLKISGSQSTYNAPEPYIPRSPLYRRWNQLFHNQAIRNPWLYLFGLR